MSNFPGGDCAIVPIGATARPAAEWTVPGALWTSARDVDDRCARR